MKQSHKMNSRRSFGVDRKKFDVFFTNVVVEIRERSKSVMVTIELEIGLVNWLVWKLKGIISDRESDPKVGFLGSRKGKAMDLTLTVKCNKRGFFLSVLYFSNTFKRGFICICVPRGGSSLGWESFLKALQWVICENPGSSTVRISRK